MEASDKDEVVGTLLHIFLKHNGSQSYVKVDKEMCSV